MTESESNALLLPYLTEKLGSRKKAKSLLKHFSAVVNGKVITKHNHILKSGDRIIADYHNRYLFLEKQHIKIIYEDSEIIVTDKPHGLLSVCAGKENLPNAFDVIKNFVKAADKNAELYLTHRLDKNTSGVLLFTKTRKTKEALQDNWNSLAAERLYRAVAQGIFRDKQGVIVNYLKQDKNGIVFSVPGSTENTEKAVTEYIVLKEKESEKESENFSLLDISIKTGKKNQIRVALKGIGHPVAGDKKYGASSNPLKRTGLHARRLTIIHPFSGEKMTFDSKPPEIFNKLFR